MPPRGPIRRHPSVLRNARPDLAPFQVLEVPVRLAVGVLDRLLEIRRAASLGIHERPALFVAALVLGRYLAAHVRYDSHNVKLPRPDAATSGMGQTWW